MTKTEFLSASLPYGLKVKKTVFGIYELIGKNNSGTSLVNYNDWVNDSKIIPVIHPLSDLTKPCVQADYNDGNPFVPIVELAKIAFGDISVIETKNKKNISGVRFVDEDSDTCVLAYHHETGSFGAHVERLEKTENEFINVYYQLQLFQQLFKWHFDLITEDCEKVYVTDEFNPYK